jgi:2-dehydro-3-deoxyphosphooctonate aldolase (KDO 8-P synthase)
MQPFLQNLFAAQDYEPDHFFLIAGPCVVESEDLVLEVAQRVSTICTRLGIPLIFKSSYKKANRTSAASYTGPGDKTGLEIIERAGKKFNLPIFIPKGKQR